MPHTGKLYFFVALECGKAVRRHRNFLRGNRLDERNFHEQNFFETRDELRAAICRAMEAR